MKRFREAEHDGKGPVPGFCDIQVNGYKGVDFSSATLTAETFTEACWSLVADGSVIIFPTVITSSLPTYRHVLTLMDRVLKESPELEKHVPGIHLEGPFLSTQPGACGCHPKEAMMDPSISTFDELYDWSGDRVKILTLAAELPGATDLSRHASAKGVLVAVGHSLASAEQLQSMSQNGARLLTHLGNGMPNMVNRHNNGLITGLAADDFFASIITDGHHLPADLLKVMVRAKTSDRLVVISDIAPVGGLPPGQYTWVGKDVLVGEDGSVRDPVNHCFAGSGSNMLLCMQHLWSLKLLSDEELLRVGFFNPLRLVGLDPEKIAAAVCEQASLKITQAGFEYQWTVGAAKAGQ